MFQIAWSRIWTGVYPASEHEDVERTHSELACTAERTLTSPAIFHLSGAFRTTSIAPVSPEGRDGGDNVGDGMPVNVANV